MDWYKQMIVEFDFDNLRKYKDRMNEIREELKDGFLDHFTNNLDLKLPLPMPVFEIA